MQHKTAGMLFEFQLNGFDHKDNKYNQQINTNFLNQNETGYPISGIYTHAASYSKLSLHIKENNA